MITAQQIKTRVSGIYGPMVKRFGPKFWRSGRRNGQLRTPGQDIPFTKPELPVWVMDRVGFNAIPCRYCGGPIDALSLSLDHDWPAARGGSLGLENLAECCAQCNRIKGGLTGVEFTQLLVFLDKLNIAAKADIVGRLKVGAMGARLRYFGKSAESAGE